MYCICENLNGISVPFGRFPNKEEAVKALTHVKNGFIEERDH